MGLLRLLQCLVLYVFLFFFCLLTLLLFGFSMFCTLYARKKATLLNCWFVSFSLRLRTNQSQTQLKKNFQRNWRQNSWNNTHKSVYSEKLTLHTATHKTLNAQGKPVRRDRFNLSDVIAFGLSEDTNRLTGMCLGIGQKRASSSSYIRIRVLKTEIKSG